MILSIRNSILGRAFSFLMIGIFLLTLNPVGSYALTGGPAQPEFNSFTPIGTSDMVDLASGDFSYNIPLMDIGGFPINLAYNSGVTMDQEASWVGLGWDLSIGQINRQMRGLPDDFDGDVMTYENNKKNNFTVGGSVGLSGEVVGIKVLDKIAAVAGAEAGTISVSLGFQYNSYNGISIKPSFGLSFDISDNASVGFQASSGPDGLVVSPSASLHTKRKTDDSRDHKLKGTVGASFNSRQGLSSVNLSTSYYPDAFKPKNNGKDRKIRNGRSGVGSSKSFVANTYTPTIENNIITGSGTFNTAAGIEAFGVEGETEQTFYFSSQILAKKIDKKMAYGYENTQKSSEDGVLDFNREKDGVFTENSTNLPITNYTYDLYSVNGQGVSGMFQPFRSQVGYVYSDETQNNSADIGGGAEVSAGVAFHVGFDAEMTVSDSKTGAWEEDNNALTSFQPGASDYADYEEVYFKNVGDLSVDENLENFEGAGETNLGAYNPIRLKIGGGKYARTLQNTYEVKNKSDWPINSGTVKRNKRVKRNQNIQKVNVYEAGLTNEDSDPLLPDFIINPAATDKSHHTAGFIVTRNDGARYNYGKALYNTTKKEVTFATGKGLGGALVDQIVGDASTGLLTYEHGVDNTIDNKHGDHYLNAVTTPEYAHTFLLTSLLSTDYSDIDETPGSIYR